MSFSWIAKLNESDSRLHKEAVIKSALTAAKLDSTNAINFLKLARDAYNPYITYGIKQIPVTEGLTDQENPWSDFMVLLDQLSQRQLTGNAARQAIELMSQRFDSEEWNGFCRAVICKDLRAGVSEKTINKICKKTAYEIPVFGCQLATNNEGRPEMRGLKRLEPKLDGVRVLMYVTGVNSSGQCEATCFSRNGKVFENFGHIENQIKANIQHLMGHYPRLFANGFVLDGEVIGNTFQELMRQARRKENVQATDSVFNIFDVIPLNDFIRGGWNKSLRERIGILESLRPVFDRMPNVELLPHINVDLDTGSGRDQFHRYCKDVVAQGFEGAMIKDLEAPYECKRNTFWLKYKPTITVDLAVVGVEEGTGRNEGRLGALICSGIDDGKEITVNVGSGFSDEDRDDYWQNSPQVIGRTAEILCDVITKNQDGTYSLRFPRFVRFRDDK